MATHVTWRLVECRCINSFYFFMFVSRPPIHLHLHLHLRLTMMIEQCFGCLVQGWREWSDLKYWLIQAAAVEEFMLMAGLELCVGRDSDCCLKGYCSYWYSCLHLLVRWRLVRSSVTLRSLWWEVRMVSLFILLAYLSLCMFYVYCIFGFIFFILFL